MTERLALIPARGGSKRLPGKNTRMMAGRPMIAWTVDAALEAKTFDRIVVSTDDEAIAEAARDAGAEAPFLRPASLADDAASSVDVALHAFEELGTPDILVLLQPTSPLREPDDIKRCLDIVEAGAPAAVTVRKFNKPWAVYRRLDQEGGLFPCPEPSAIPNAMLTGSVYAIRAEALQRERSFLPEGVVGVDMPEARSIDVDYEEEFALCEALLTARKLSR